MIQEQYVAESRVSDSKKLEIEQRPSSVVEILPSQSFVPPILPIEKVSQLPKGRSRKTEPLEPAKLTEDEIRVKYQNNEEYLDWTRKIPRFKLQLEAILTKGLPVLYSTDELSQILEDHSRISSLRDTISEMFLDFKVQNIEPSGELNPSIDAFLEDDEVRHVLFKIFAFTVEASSLNTKELRKKCLNSLNTDFITELSNYITEDDVEELISSMALRKPYGVKGKNLQVYADTQPLSLWCWEVTDVTLLEPVTKTQIEKARTQRMIVGKKLQFLKQVIELC